MAGAEVFEHPAQVFGGGLVVLEVELDAGTLGDGLGDADHSGGRVRADEVPDQEVPPARFFDELVHHDSNVQGELHQLAVALVEVGEHLLQGGQRRCPVEIVDQVLLRPRYLHHLAYGAAALRDDRGDVDVAGEGEPGRPFREHGLVYEERVHPRTLEAARKPPDLRRAGVGVVHAGQQEVRPEGEWVSEQDEVRLARGVRADQFVPAPRRAVEVRQVFGAQVEGCEFHPRQGGGDHRERR